MAYILRPRQGEEVYDYACGSAGLLIKCELVLLQRERKISRPLRLYGQELTGSSYAIARMNMVVHDMDGEIVRGNSMTNPKFRESDTSLKKFDIVVANPMWNQDIDPKTYDNDPFDRFDSQGGRTAGKADWAWLQHTLACLKPNGRAAVVLDTGAVSRGSGKKNEDKEKTIRKWFVQQDVIEGVVLLPEDLFYNTPADAIIVVLNKQKPKARVGKILFVNASAEFKKGQPKNFIPPEGVRKIANAFNAGTELENFVRVIDSRDVAAHDFNLSPSLYVSVRFQRTVRPISSILDDFDKLESESAGWLKGLRAINRGLRDSRLAKPLQRRMGDTALGLLPTHWQVAHLGDKCYKPQYGLTASATSNKAGPKFLRITDITEGGVNWDSVPYCVCSEDLIETYRLKHDDILFARIGATTGKSFIVKNPPHAVFASYLIRIRPKDEVWPDFLYYFFRSEAYWKQVDANKGNNLKGGVNGSILSQLLIPVPPMPEQKRIATALRGVEKHAHVADRWGEVLTDLMRAFVQKTLTGSLSCEVIDMLQSAIRRTS